MRLGSDPTTSLALEKIVEMLGDLMGLMQKAKDARKKIEEAKAGLDHHIETVQDSEGYILMKITANRAITEINLSETAMRLPKGQLEDILQTTTNEAIAKATRIQEERLAEVAREEMPSIPGLDQFFR